MRRITFPFQGEDQTSDIANLQEALRFLLERQAILPDDHSVNPPVLKDPERRKLYIRLRDDRGTYGDVTQEIIHHFRTERQIEEPNRDLDERTVAELNRTLESLGAFDDSLRESRRVVAGRVVYHNGRIPFAGRVVLFRESLAGAVKLGEDLTDPEGGYSIEYTLPAQATLRVCAFDNEDRRRAEKALETVFPVEVIDLVAEGEGRDFQVSGTVTSGTRAGIGGLRVLIVDKNVGGDATIDETTTGGDGQYLVGFTYSGSKQQPDLEAHAMNGEVLLGASRVCYNASNIEVLDIRLQVGSSNELPTEHETLTNDLKAHFAGDLRDLQETDQQQDITYLANKTGWDARAVALTSLADKFSSATADAEAGAIDPALFYALFRAGIPADDASLYGTDTSAVEAIWQQGIKQGVVPDQLRAQIPDALKRFNKLSADRMLSGAAVEGVSSLAQMLEVSLPNAQADERDQIARQFVELGFEHQNQPEAFWEAVETKFGRERKDRLQLDGRLGFLTLNNAGLAKKLHDQADQTSLTDPVDLVARKFYRPEKWLPMIDDNAIPREIGGANEERKDNYAEALATQLRVAYPNAVLADMIKSGDTPVKEGFQDRVGEFLLKHHDKFDIGTESIEQYCVRNQINEPDLEREITRIQRVRQITPSDDAMNALLKKGVDSSHAVVQFDREEFVAAFKDQVGGEASAQLIHAKAQQVHSTILNLAASYLIAKNAAGIGVHSPAQIVSPAPNVPDNAGDVIAYPTLEKLFGDMDYCECDHCRSVLSPAAYLVDLLHFLDRDKEAWDEILNRWKTLHGGVVYPYATAADFVNAGQPADSQITPLEVLLSRRPDIQHLPLTCENTNIALPYIDIVNETLEYFITQAKLSLEGYEGHSTDGSAASPELMSSPQFVTDKAYDILSGKENLLPLPPVSPLPFHRPLETLRRSFDKFEVPLAVAMEILRTNESVEGFGEGDYGWRDIRLETLNISRKEHEILTKREATVPETLRELYGFRSDVPDDDIVPELSNAKAFARRLNISYDELIKILGTRFINPNGTLIPRLERLRVPFATLKELKDNNDAATGKKFNEAVAPKIDSSQYGGDIKAWVRKQENYDRIMNLIILDLEVSEWKASTVYSAGDRIIPTDPLKGSSVYYECTAAGTTGAAEPDPWVKDEGDMVTDGTAVWTVRSNSAGYDFEKLAFRYSDPAKRGLDIRPFEFVKMLRFIRLWEKLGWNIEQTDKAITALYPADQVPDSADDAENLKDLDAGFLELLPRLGVLKRTIHVLNLRVEKDLLPLLACFAPLDTYGTDSLYRRLFLDSALYKQDAAFADTGYGSFLVDESEKLICHVDTLRAALNLTNDELNLAIVHAGIGPVSVETTYEHTSAKLDQKMIDAAAGLGYDHDKKRLFYYGCVGKDLQEKLKNVPGVSGEFKTAIDELFQASQATLARLTIDNVSAIYRRGWLARKLKLSMQEFVLLIDHTGIDPFSGPDPVAPAVLRFVEFVSRLRSVGLKPTQALYLIWNRDISRKSEPERKAINEFARSLRSGFATVESQFAVADDPDGRIARERILLVYDGATTDLFFALLDDTFVTETSYARGNEPLITWVEYDHGAQALGQAITDASEGKIGYDDVKKQLRFEGLLMPEVRDALKAVAGVSDGFKVAIDHLHEANAVVMKEQLDSDVINAAPGRTVYDDFRKKFSFRGEMTDKVVTLMKVGASRDLEKALDDLFDQNKKVGTMFASYPELRSAFDVFVGSVETVDKKRTKLLDQLLPEIKKRQKRQQAIQAISAAAKTDAAFANSVLDSAAVLSAAGGSSPAIDDLTEIEKPGLSVKFFLGETEAAPVAANREFATGLSYGVRSSDDKLPANNGNPIFGIWDGYVEAPETAFYKVRIEAEDGADVTFTLDGNAVELAGSGRVWTNKKPIALRAGSLYAFDLSVKKIKETMKVQWQSAAGPQSASRGWESIPVRCLYAGARCRNLRAAYTRFFKTASMASALDLSANAIVYLSSNKDQQIANAGWLNSLPVDGIPDKALSSELFKALNALIEFVLIKKELETDNDQLVSVLSDPSPTGERWESTLFALTRWEQASLDVLLSRFGQTRSDLAHLATFRRVLDAYGLVDALGISASTLISSATNEPAPEIVRDFQSALRARRTESDWENTIKPINDELRSMQRDALVAYVLHQMKSDPKTAHIDTADKLFEYFLMDVEMAPCMQTSRIRHALSSVQLFIERCLMNLELRVASSIINAKQWEWMKLYRLWEANRKVFLWPENWLEPELRDDASPFFKEAMSELLQSDITDDRAAAALLNYLGKLGEVAKLEPCGLFVVENDPADLEDDVSHVVARTSGANRKYYYRRCESGSWTAWEQIKLDIEDNPVIPVVWKDRVFLFWLRILKEMPDAAHKTIDAGSGKNLDNVNTSDIEQGPPRVKVGAILCWSEYFAGKWQPANTSDLTRPTSLGDYPSTGADTFDRSQVFLSAYEEGQGLRIKIFCKGPSSFFLHNTHSAPLREEEAPIESSILLNTPPDQRYRLFPEAPGSLIIKYGRTSKEMPRPILTVPNTGKVNGRTVEPCNYQRDPWVSPFFYEDAQHVFHVRTDQKLVTVSEYKGYGGAAPKTSGVSPFVVPPLVIQPTVPIIPDLIGPVIKEKEIQVLDRISMTSLLSEDAYINKGLDQTGTVKFGKKKIGLTGTVGNIREEI